MSKLRVLIVGASIAGPTAAYWFAKAGASVTVIERFTEFRTNGQNVDIRTAGVAVMRKMPGMEAAVKAKVLPIEAISFVRDDGRPYGLIKPTGDPNQQSLVSEYEIYRGDLAKILFDMTAHNENIKYVFGEQISSMQQNEKEGSPITVDFANGYPTADYDLVVACDGATSRTRAIGLNCGYRDHMEPINAWAAFFTLDKDLHGGANVGRAHSAVGGRFIACGRDPSGATRVALMGFNRRQDQQAMAPFREAMKQGDEAVKRFIVDHYKGVGWKSDEVMEHIMESRDFYVNEICQVKTPSIYKGRFVLVGDAGYAPGPTGGGTTLALAGAYVLAGEVNKHKGDLAAGLKGYEETMRPLITDLQKIPFLIPGVLAPQTAWGLWFRNQMFAFVARSRIMEFGQRFFAGSFDNIERHPLPDYHWTA